MAGKPRPLLIEKSDFRIFFMAMMGSLGLTVETFAEKIGVTGTTVYALLSGDMEPSDEIIAKVGLRTVYMIGEKRPEWIESISPAPTATPAKARTKRI